MLQKLPRAHTQFFRALRLKQQRIDLKTENSKNNCVLPVSTENKFKFERNWWKT